MIGDFTWTDYDYLGEAGIGIPHYGEVTAQGMFPDRLAYCGDIDLNAARRPVSYLREIAFGLRQEPYIAVQRPEVFEKTFDQNNWKYFDSLHSWTYPGQEGRPTRVYVLADCDEVELTVNGKSLGRKKIGEALPYTAAYDVDYQPGGLKAVGYRDGKPCGEDLLGTAGAVAAMKVAVSNGTVRAGGQGLSFVTVDLVDENDTPNLSDGRAVTVKVEGTGSLQGFGSADPSSEGSYQNRTCPAFHGRVLAVIRGGMEAGKCRVTFSAGGLEDVSVTLQVTAPEAL